MRFLSVALLVIALAGCVAPVLQPVDFAAVGRLAVRGEIAGNKVAETAHFRWQQIGKRTEVELGSPLGETQARLIFDADHAELIDAHGQRTQARDAETLLFDVTGYIVPVMPLRWWLEGKSMPDLPLVDEGVDAEGIHRFVQAGWRVSLGAPAPVYPKSIELERDALDVRIAITDWPR